jgi:hypothetical protein
VRINATRRVPVSPRVIHLLVVRSSVRGFSFSGAWALGARLAAAWRAHAQTLRACPPAPAPSALAALRACCAAPPAACRPAAGRRKPKGPTVLSAAPSWPLGPTLAPQIQ